MPNEFKQLVKSLAKAASKDERTPIVPVPNRWFLQPDKFPAQQGLVNKVLESTGRQRTDFPSGAFINPRTGEVLDSRIFEDVSVAIDPVTNRPVMSAGKQSGLEVINPALGSYTKSNLVRKGLFKPTGGDPLLNDLNFIATIEKGGVGHKYGLATEYATPTEMYNTGTGDNPTLRPRSRGDLFGMGDVVGQVRIGRADPHNVYESLFVAPKGSDVPGVKLNKKFDEMKDGGLKKTVKQSVKEFVDPPSKHLNDWQWRQLQAVQRDVPLKEVPDYIQKGYGQFMAEQAKRAAAGDLSARDLLKAYLITQSSIGRQGLAYDTATKAGLKVPRTDELVRPEGAFATWLGSKAGQKYLDAAMKGDLDKKALAEIQAQFAPFGKQNALAQSMEYAADVAPKMAADLNKAITGTADEYRDYAEQLKGVAGSKSGFIGSMLGRGDLPTFDARQIYLHTAGQPLPTATPSSVLNRGKGFGGREAVDRLAARQEAMGLVVDPAYDPFYQHLTHHAVWDKIGNDKTTHQDIIDAMKNYKSGGPVHMKDGSSVFDQPSTEELKQASKAAYGKQRMFGMTRPEPKEESEPAYMSAYSPTLRQTIGKGIRSGLQYLGSPSSQARNVSHLFTEPSANVTSVISPLDLVPYLGTAVGLQEGLQNAKESMEQGDKIGALIDLAVGVAPGSFSTIAAAPATGRALKRGVQAGERYAERKLPKIMERGGPLADALTDLTKGSRSQIFIGPSAATWDAAAAKKAYGMERAGKTPLEIWKETGTFKAADGNWRQEISDVGSKFVDSEQIKELLKANMALDAENKARIAQSNLHPDLFPTRLAQAQKELREQNQQLKFERTRPYGLKSNPERVGNLSRIAFKHPELYEAYPTLANLPLMQGNLDLKGAQAALTIKRGGQELGTGKYLPEAESVSVNTFLKNRGKPRSFQSDILHEMQHAIQTIEDWAPGGQPNPNSPKALEIYERLKNEQAAGAPVVPDDRLRALAAHQAYKQMAGEAEARATEARKRLTAQQRREIVPSITYDADVPLESQIVEQPMRFAPPQTPSIDAMRMKAWDGKVEGMKKGGKKVVKQTIESVLPSAATKPASAAEKEAIRSMGIVLPSEGTVGSGGNLIRPHKNIAKTLGAEERAARQRAIEAEGLRAEAAKNVQPSVGYRESTATKPDPLVGTRYDLGESTGIITPSPFAPEKHLGANMSVIDWDTSSRNRPVRGISGHKLDIETVPHGGYEWTLDQSNIARGSGGASGATIVPRIADRLNTSATEGTKRGGTGEALGVVQTMSTPAIDFGLPKSQIIFNLVNQRLKEGKITQAQADELAKLVATRNPKVYGDISRFAGFNPEGWNQIHLPAGETDLKAPLGKSTTAGKLRTAIGEVANLVSTQKLLDYNIEDLQNALIAERLRNVPKGQIGATVMQVPEGGVKVMDSPLYPWKSPYSHEWTAKPVGQFQDMINTEALFYRTLDPIKRELLTRELKRDYNRDTLHQAAISALAKNKQDISQLVDNQFVDDYYTYLDELKKRNEYKEGGAVHMEDGGITSDDLIVEEKAL